MLTPRRWCAETQGRTADTAIFSRVLYQLSYLGVKRPVFYNSADRLSSNYGAQQQRRALQGTALLLVGSIQLARLHVLGLQTLGACRHLELHLLAFD